MVCWDFTNRHLTCSSLEVGPSYLGTFCSPLLRFDDQHSGVLQTYKCRWRSTRISFIDKEHVLVLDNSTLRIFNLSSGPREPPSVVGGYMFELGLPFTGRIQWINFFAGPTSTTPYCSDDCMPMFHGDPEKNIIAFTIGHEDPNNDLVGTPFFVGHLDDPSLFIVPLSTLQALCRENSDAWKKHIPWEQWGPQGASWIKLLSHPMHLAVSGTRAAISFSINDNMVEVVLFDISRDFHVREEIPAFPMRSGFRCLWIQKGAKVGAGEVRKQVSLPYRAFCRSFDTPLFEGRYEEGIMFFIEDTLAFAVRFLERVDELQLTVYEQMEKADFTIFQVLRT